MYKLCFRNWVKQGKIYCRLNRWNFVIVVVVVVVAVAAAAAAAFSFPIHLFCLMCETLYQLMKAVL